MTIIDEQPKKIINEIKNEDNKSKKGQSLEEQFPYPWSEEIDEEIVKNAIVALSLDNRNFLISPGENFYFNLNDNLHYTVNLLKFDKRLETLRNNIVPKQIKEDEFWKNYFYRISLIKSGQDIKTLPDIFLPEEIPKAEEPEELKKKGTEELFSTNVFDKDEEEELLKDFEKEIGDAIRLEDIKYEKSTTTNGNDNDNANPTNEKINTEELNSSVNGDIDSLDAINTKELNIKIEVENDKLIQADKTNNITDEAINITFKTNLESKNGLSKKPKRALTPYNQFMKQELSKIKAEQPNISHKAAFKEAAQRWKISPDNPKNKADSYDEKINTKELNSSINGDINSLDGNNTKELNIKIEVENDKLIQADKTNNTTDEAINTTSKTNLESKNGLSKKPKRALTPYNQFMKQELPKIKAEQPNISHKAAFMEAAQRWKISPNNPKNKADSCDEKINTKELNSRI